MPSMVACGDDREALYLWFNVHGSKFDSAIH